MDEKTWLASEDPGAMLEHLRPSNLGVMPGPMEEKPRLMVSSRKLLLFACACVRQVWHTLDDYSRRLVGQVEEYAESGKRPAWISDRDDWPDCFLVDRVGDSALWTAEHFAWGNKGTIDPDECAAITVAPPEVRAAILRDIVGSPWRPVTLPVCEGCYASDEHGAAGNANWRRSECPCCDGAGRHADWLTPRVMAGARSAYEERLADGRLDPALLCMVSDALQEDGCPESVECERCSGHGWLGKLSHVAASRTKPCDTKGCRTGRIPHPLLAHLRSPGHPYRGMWSLDVLLGLE